MARLKVDPIEKYPICERCGKKAYRVDSIDTSRLTGKASYWREFTNKIHICSRCSKELSEVVNQWWLEKGKSKF